MATYSVYDNILVKLENVFLRVETEVDKEITSLQTEHTQLNHQLTDLKTKMEVLASLKRSFELYCDKPHELESLNNSVFKVLCNKQIRLRFFQEKEILLSCYQVSGAQLPSIIQINKEFKLRKHLQEVELLSSFLLEDSRFCTYCDEVERANEIFDLALESGASDKLESAVKLFSNFFEKVVNLYDVDPQLVEEFNEFKTQIMLQANDVSLFIPSDVANSENLGKIYQQIHSERFYLESEVEKLLYQYTMLQNGKKITLGEIRNTSGELESILFKEYAVKQKINELKQYKMQLNSQKDDFMKDPTVDGYSEAVAQLENVEHRFRRLLMHKNFEKQTLVWRYFATNKTKMSPVKDPEEKSPYNKILFQVLHNSHVSSHAKKIVLRLSKPSKLINANSGKFFFQRAGKTRSLQKLENSFQKFQFQEVH